MHIRTIAHRLILGVRRLTSYCNWCGSSSGHESWCSGR